jgi:hypothetical protein
MIAPKTSLKSLWKWAENLFKTGPFYKWNFMHRYAVVHALYSFTSSGKCMKSQVILSVTKSSHPVKFFLLFFVCNHVTFYPNGGQSNHIYIDNPEDILSSSCLHLVFNLVFWIVYDQTTCGRFFSYQNGCSKKNWTVIHLLSLKLSLNSINTYIHTYINFI